VTLQERLASPLVEERGAAIAELGARGSATAEELAALADCLGHQRKAVQRPAAEAFAALRTRGVDVDPVLWAALAAAEPRRRWGAAFALSLLGDPPVQTLPVVLDTLGSDDGDLRWAAEKILLRMPDRAGVAAALGELVSTGNAAQRKMALYGLRDLAARTPAVEAATLAALEDADTGVRQAAVACLAHLAVDRARAAARLVAVLDDPDARLRRGAAAALGTLGERSAPVLAALRGAAAGADAGLKRAAARSLRLLGS
jgi:HEAT repeat protein